MEALSSGRPGSRRSVMRKKSRRSRSPPKCAAETPPAEAETKTYVRPKFCVPARPFFEELPVRHVQSHRYNCTLISPGNGSTIGGMGVFVDIRCTVKERCPPAENCPHCYNMCKLLSQCLSTRIVVSMDGQVSASAPPALARTKSRCLAQRSLIHILILCRVGTMACGIPRCVGYHAAWDTMMRGIP